MTQSHPSDVKTAPLLDALRTALGASAVKTDPAETAPYCRDWRDRFGGEALCVVEPADPQGVAAAVRIAAAHDVRIVPQGGNTGLVAGAVPLGNVSASGPGAAPELVLSLRRLNRIRDVDPLDNVLVAEAGVVLATAQQAATAVGRLLPLGLASEGSAQIGGVVSTNAGGTAVLRYGNTRELILGLEVVLADGRLWNGLQRLRKDNTGYDLKQLFIGAEGTLGIVTAAALKLFPAPLARATAFVALPSPEAAVRLLRHLQTDLGDSLTAFELVERACLDLVFATMAGARDPFCVPSPWYALVEVSITLKGIALTGIVEQSLAEAFALGLATDAVLAQTETQRADLWRLRETITESERQHGPSAKHDISVPVSRVPTFLALAPAAVRAVAPEARPIAFGHLGDGNIHFNVLAPADATDVIGEAVYDLVARLGGSISAEHGIGRSKVALLARHKDAVSLSLMRRLRTTLDPAGRLNPGKILAASDPKDTA